MFKIFTFAVVALMPLTARKAITDFAVFNPQGYVLSLKNIEHNNPFEDRKEPVEPWSQSWMSDAQENIRKSEYHFKWEKKMSAYFTPNRKNNLRFYYNEKGFTVEPRTTKIPIDDTDPMARPDEIKYRTIPNWKVQFNLDKKQVGKGVWRVEENKAEYVTDNITVQYINNEEGMRQNFIVHKPLSKKDELAINIKLKTILKTFVKNNQVQFKHNNREVLVYKDLKVWDATGRLLTASFEQNRENKIWINVDTRDAVYPITVDPLSTTPNTFLESNQVGARMGFAVSSAGDVNGDGYSDVVVGVHAYDDGETDEGAAFVYHGSATGISNTIAAIVQSNQPGAIMGLSVRTAGDVNGDGYSDIIVGSPLFDNGDNNEGAAFVYHGSTTGIITTAAAMVESNQDNAQLGYSVACAGDVNGDGFSDVILGAWLYDSPDVNEGAAFIYHGSATGISTTAAATVESNQAAANFGMSVAGAGDVNGDGYSDIIVGAEDYDDGQTDEGVVFIYHGSATGVNTTAAVVLQENLTLSQFGFAVSGAGDVNGDGYSDIIVGAYLYANGQANEGVAFVYHGSAAGINNLYSTLLEANQVAASFGVSVSCAGDINGDGYSDVIVGANLYDDVENNEGAAFVYQGSATGINSATVVILQMNQANADMGRGVGAAGDVNGDGYSDVIVGANQYDNPQNSEGAAFVYHGSSDGLSPLQTRILSPVNQNLAGIGNAVAGAGDVNGDGFSDVIIGALGYDDGVNTDEGRAWVYYGSSSGLSAIPDVVLDDANQASAYFGYSVASAGDINGDGYADVVVGAYGYDESYNDEGRAWVHYGSAAGLSVTPNRVLDDANQLGAVFGFSVSTAGDVNSDGFADVIVGAIGYDDNFIDEGRAYVYYGSTTGLAATPGSMPDDADQAGARFGGRVANIGDVNGDGYSDVGISAGLFDDTFVDEGVVFIYYGGAAGLSATANAILDDGNQAGAVFGSNLAGAGDVNGDGFADVLVTSIWYDGQKGRAWVYYGHATTGLSPVPDVVLDNTAGLAGDRLGYGASTAGDINGDGYSDVIVGMPQRSVNFSVDGQAYIYYGSAAGLPNTPGLVIHDATEAHEFFGLSTACAGDINGDGYSDVVVGADHGSYPSSFGGRAYIHNGNISGSNKRNSLRLYNTDLTTPVNSSNFVLGNFGAGLNAKSFLGRAKGKLVWETRLNFDPYSGTPITNSTFFTDQQNSYINLGLTGVEIKALVNKIWYGGRYTKLRARVKYDPVTAITGQVYGPWRYVSSIIDANSLGALPVELISFRAAWLQKGKTARLDFKTDKENGICCFDIEKSTDGFNFYPIGTVPAKNLSAIQSYSFIDGNANGKNQYYRIKIKGLAGKHEFSNIQQLQNDKATEILVFPNPTTDKLQLQLNNAYEKINLQIINSTGQLVTQLVLSAANQTISVPVQNLAPGKYWLHLQSGAEKQVLQFVKQ